MLCYVGVEQKPKQRSMYYNKDVMIRNGLNTDIDEDIPYQP